MVSDLTAPISDSECSHSLELAPNGSLTPRTARLFMIVVAAGALGVAAPFVLHGFWPVLVFAILEIAWVRWALLLSMRASRRREVITVTHDTVVLTRQSCRDEQLLVFPRHWSKVTLHAPPAALHPSRLMIESRGRACEVGRFLTEDERRRLATRLKQLVGEMNESPAL